MSKSQVIVKMNATQAVRDALRNGGLMQAALRGANVIETFAKVNASGGRPGLDVDTGALVNSIQTQEDVSNPDYASAKVGPSVEYAAIHEFGGIIRPIKAKLLSWMKDGERIFAKMVQIPARPYMRPAVDEHEGDIVNAVETSLRETIGGAL